MRHPVRMRRTWARRLVPVFLVDLLLGATACSSTATTEPPQATPTPTASALGRYDVATRTLHLTDASRAAGQTQGRALPTTLWYPSTGTGPFPVVIFSHGVESKPSTYSDLLSGWASAGFVVAAPTFPLTNSSVTTVYRDIINQPADVSFVLTQVLALDTTSGDDLEGRIDPGHIAATGHSGGAITTLGLLNTCCADPRFTAAVVLSGALTEVPTPYTQPGVPMFFAHGTADSTIAIADGEAAYAAAPGPKAFLRLNQGSHASPYNNKPADVLFPTVRATTTDFLRWALAGDTAALAELRKAATQKGLTELSADALGG